MGEIKNNKKDEKCSENIVDDATASYLARLLKTDEKIIKKIADNKDDAILISQQASKRRLNKRTLATIDPRMSALLMSFKEGEKIGASFNDNVYSANMLYKFFFKRDTKLNLNKISKDKNPELAAQACLIIKIFFTDSLEEYCEEYSDTNYSKTLSFLNECIKKGFSACKNPINFDNCEKTLEEVRKKYL